MIYEIINPSDPYTMEAPDLEIASLACFMLSKMFGVEGDDEANTAGPWIGIGTADEWFVERFGAKPVDRLKARREDVAAALDSVLICAKNDRQDYYTALALIDDPVKREEWRQGFHDRRRSSMSNIGQVAWNKAAALRSEQ